MNYCSQLTPETDTGTKDIAFNLTSTVLCTSNCSGSNTKETRDFIVPSHLATKYRMQGVFVFYYFHGMSKSTFPPGTL